MQPSPPVALRICESEYAVFCVLEYVHRIEMSVEEKSLSQMAACLQGYECMQWSEHHYNVAQKWPPRPINSESVD